MNKKIIYINNVIILLAIYFTCTPYREPKNQSQFMEPVILVPGYGNKAEFWEEKGFLNFLEDNKIGYAGKIATFPEKNPVFASNDSSEYKDVFLVEFSDPTNAINELAVELKSSIEFVTKFTKSKKIMLVGYSIGGLICRYYLTNNLESHKVNTLVTICSPHLGSGLADKTYGLLLLLNGVSETVYESIAELIGMQDLLQGAALSQLVTEENGFLDRLNKKKHPLDLSYISIIGKVDQLSFGEMLREIWNNLKNLIKSPADIIKVGNAIFNYIKGLISDGGDLIVSTSSQNMMNIEFFSNAGKPVLLNKYVVNDVTHFSIVNEHKKLYNIIRQYMKSRFKKP